MRKLALAEFWVEYLEALCQEHMALAVRHGMFSEQVFVFICSK